MRVRGAIAALTCGVVLGSCIGDIAYLCSTDADCASADGGVCEINSLCSYPDDECDTGRRYSELAGDLAGMCTGTFPDDTESSGVTPDATSTTTTSMTDPPLDSSSGVDADSSDDGPQPGCGNEVVEDDEECDDGNEQDGDGCNTDCVAGGSIRWERFYAGAGDDSDRYFELIRSGSDAVVTTGFVYEQSSNRDVLISRWTVDGRESIHAIHDAGANSDSGEAIIEAPNGDLFICGTTMGGAWISRWSPDLELIAELVPTGVPGTCRDMVFVSDDEIAAVGSGFREAWVYHFDPDDIGTGEFVNVDAQDKDVDIQNWTGFESAALDSSEQLWVGGWIDGQAVVYQPAPADLGMPLYTSEDLRHPQAMLVLEDGFILGGETYPEPNARWLQRYSLMSRSQWEFVGTDSLDAEFEDLTLAPDGGIYAIGFVTGDMADRWIGKFDPEGNLLWSRDDYPMSDLGVDRGRSVVVLPDSGDLIVVAQVFNGTDTDAWIARLAP